MQKLLIHINILLAFIVLFCSHSAFGQGTAPVGNPKVTFNGRDYSDIPNSNYIVDLGLSDVYWADRNVGAKGTTDAGDYFAWGETSIKQCYHMRNYIYYKKNGYTEYYNKYWCNTQYPDASANFIRDNLTTLLQIDDAASKIWLLPGKTNSQWHIPTISQINNLINNCKFSRSNKNAIFSRNSKSITIPASGYYWELAQNYLPVRKEGNIPYFWSSELDPTQKMEDNSYRSMCFKLNSLSWPYQPELYSGDRFSGIPVRPVIDKYTVSIKNIVDGQEQTLSKDTINVPNGTKITLSASDYGCYDLKWIVVNANGSETFDGGDTKEFSITSNTTITASFTRRKYSVSISANPEDAAKKLSGADEYACGTTATLTATADECYQFVKWSDEITENPRSLTVTQDTTLTAVFTVKTTNVKAKTDSKKGGVGLNVWK